MTEPSPFVLAPVPPASADPRLLTLHLDICRMKAELELLETRIGRIRASEAEAAADTRPFVDRAQDLLDLTVSSIYEGGRGEIEAIDRQSRLDAEARLSEASRHAHMLLAAAREDLANALTERAEAVAPARADAADVVILPDDGLLVLPGDDLVGLPDPGLMVLPGEGAITPSDGGLMVVPGDDVLLVLTEPVEPVESAPVLEPIAMVGGAVEASVEDAGAAAEPAAPVDAPPPASLGLPGLGGSWSSSDMSRTPLATGASETTRADAAFDVWLAMAPPVAPDDETESFEADVAGRGNGKGRPVWLRPMEAAAALVLVAIFVAVGLVLVG